MLVDELCLQGERALLEQGAVPPLVQLLRDEDEQVRVKAAGALWNLAECAEGNSAVILADAVPALLDVSNGTHNDPELKQRAVGALVRSWCVVS